MNAIARKLIVVAAGVGLLLLVPLAAMQVTDEVNWTATDFGAAAILLSSAGLAYVALTSIAPRRRFLAGAAVLVVLALVWAELAVGVLGSPWAGS